MTACLLSYWLPQVTHPCLSLHLPSVQVTPASGDIHLPGVLAQVLKSVSYKNEVMVIAATESHLENAMHFHSHLHSKGYAHIVLVTLSEKGCLNWPRAVARPAGEQNRRLICIIRDPKKKKNNPLPSSLLGLIGLGNGSMLIFVAVVTWAQCIEALVSGDLNA